MTISIENKGPICPECKFDLRHCDPENILSKEWHCPNCNLRLHGPMLPILQYFQNQIDDLENRIDLLEENDE